MDFLIGLLLLVQTATAPLTIGSLDGKWRNADPKNHDLPGFSIVVKDGVATGKFDGARTSLPVAVYFTKPDDAGTTKLVAAVLRDGTRWAVLHPETSTTGRVEYFVDDGEGAGLPKTMATAQFVKGTRVF